MAVLIPVMLNLIIWMWIYGMFSDLLIAVTFVVFLFIFLYSSITLSKLLRARRSTVCPGWAGT